MAEHRSLHSCNSPWDANVVSEELHSIVSRWLSWASTPGHANTTRRWRDDGRRHASTSVSSPHKAGHVFSRRSGPEQHLLLARSLQTGVGGTWRAHCQRLWTAPTQLFDICSAFIIVLQVSTYHGPRCIADQDLEAEI